MFTCHTEYPDKGLMDPYLHGQKAL